MQNKDKKVHRMQMNEDGFGNGANECVAVVRLEAHCETRFGPAPQITAALSRANRSDSGLALWLTACTANWHRLLCMARHGVITNRIRMQHHRLRPRSVEKRRASINWKKVPYRDDLCDHR